jgi:TolA-binding protein
VTTDLHPDGLFDLERQASLTESERQARDAHLAGCASCRMEHRLRADFAREPLVGSSDRALLDRATLGALAALSQSPRSASPRKRWASAGVGLLVTGLAAAAVRSGRQPTAPLSPPPAAPAIAQHTSAGPASETPSLAPSVSDGLGVPTPGASSSVSRAPLATAPQLFARANAARRAGALPEALTLYRKLLADFPSSREALTSKVTMARALLDTQGNAGEALALFERYAQQAPAGNLADEALIGRAEALGRLGRSTDEADAWRALLARFPASAQRTRAEARLAELAPPPP